jgi:hypothetical protein
MFDRDNREPLRIAEITDGTSNQFMIAEARWKMTGGGTNRGRIFGGSDNTDGAAGASNALMLNGQWQMHGTAPQGNPPPARTAASNHPGGALFCLADGSVRFVSQNISIRPRRGTPTRCCDSPGPTLRLVPAALLDLGRTPDGGILISRGGMVGRPCHNVGRRSDRPRMARMRALLKSALSAVHLLDFLSCVSAALGFEGKSAMFRFQYAGVGMRLTLTVLVLALVLVSAGCGPGGPEIAYVTGRVTMDGKPLANATVVFIPKTAGRRGRGRTRMGSTC